MKEKGEFSDGEWVVICDGKFIASGQDEEKDC